MYDLNIGDFVVRKSYNKDILFEITSKKDNICYLKGLNARIFADAYISDLIKDENYNQYLEQLDTRGEFISNIFSSIFTEYRVNDRAYNYGKILHVDGDDRYARKSLEYYKKNNLPCTVYSISEEKQPKYLRQLIYKDKPDIVVVTGHDCLFKNRSAKNISNYKNSKYFKECIIEARKVEPSRNKLAIFAGACQSYYEELISHGANFASSPGRILIDFFDPLVVAQMLSITNNRMIVGMGSIVDKIKGGYRGVNGIPTYGKAQ